MSKLYTEEQLRKAIDLSYSYGLAKPNSGRLSDIPNVQNKIIETLTPIQLPTDEELEKIAKEKHIGLSYRRCFLQGAKWMRDKIKTAYGKGQENDARRLPSNDTKRRQTTNRSTDR